MKRRIAKLAAFILLGAVVNIAVAWGCAILMPLGAVRIWPEAASETDQAMWEQHRPAAVLSVPLFASRDGSASSVMRLVIGDQSGTARVTTDELGRVISFGWSGVNVGPTPYDHTLFVRSGWPTHAMEGSRWHVGTAMQAPHHSVLAALTAAPTPDTTTHVGAITIGRATGGTRMPRLLPLMALPAGFLFNTLFYAAILWSLFAAPFALRRLIRRRRGQCERCAYPIGVSQVCTECGAAVRMPSQRAAENTNEASRQA